MLVASAGAVIVFSTVAGSAGAAAPTTIRAFAEPEAGVAPIVSAIKSARTAIDLEIYELGDRSVETALAEAAARHVDVRVILNRKDPFESRNPNAAASAYLTARHVSVKWSPSDVALAHVKMLSVDARVSLIMSLNLAGGYSSTRDFGIIDTQPSDVLAIDTAFNADWQGTAATVRSATHDLIWSPGAGDTFVHAIESAKTSIDLENEEMDYRDATDALCAAAKRGVDVKIVMSYASEWASALRELAGCGAHVHVYYGQRYYIHAKALIVDGRSAIVGSTNLSAESLWYNRELSIEVTSPSIVTQLTSWFASDYTGGSPYAGS